MSSWYWARNWTAYPGFFPSGLGALGLPLTLYSNAYASPADGNSFPPGFDWEVSSSGNFGGIPNWAIVPASQALDFYNLLLDRGVGMWGQNALEIDFINFLVLGSTQFNTDARALGEYWGGVNAASAAHGVSTQMCMDLPLMALSSVQWSHVTNARLQGDGFPSDTQRYDIGLPSLLYSALHLAPFLDVVWSTACQNSTDNAFHGECEPDVESLVATAALSAGAVGFGDGLGHTNASLVNMTCRADGVILGPSSPATPLDMWFWGALEPWGRRARVSCAPTSLPSASGASATWLALHAVFLDPAASAAPLVVRPCDTSPPLGDGAAFWVTALAPGGAGALARACADGAPAAACAAPFSAAAPLAILTGADRHELYSIAPVLPGGWALLGELAKFVRVSPARFGAVSGGGGGGALNATLSGAPGEAIAVTLITPEALVRSVPVVFGPSGSALLACAGSECTVTATQALPRA